MKATSLKAQRKEFQEKGIFHTPDALARKLLGYVNNDPKTVYDPTCGAGALLKVFPDTVEKYGQEIEPDYLAMVDAQNFHGYCGDVLENDVFAGMTFDAIVANPPFSIKWRPHDDQRWADAPALPPPSKADWAFMLHILSHMAAGGVAVVLCFPGILYRKNKEGKIRQWFVDQNVIERVVDVPGKTFEDTDVATCLVVMRKGRKTKDIIFESGDKTVTASLEQVRDNDYVLTPNTYMPPEPGPVEEYDINEINQGIVDHTLGSVAATIEMQMTLQESFPDDDLGVDRLLKGLREIVDKYGGKEDV